MNCLLCSARVVIGLVWLSLVLVERSCENRFVFRFDCERFALFVSFRFAIVGVLGFK